MLLLKVLRKLRLRIKQSVVRGSIFEHLIFCIRSQLTLSDLIYMQVLYADHTLRFDVCTLAYPNVLLYHTLWSSIALYILYSFVLYCALLYSCVLFCSLELNRFASNHFVVRSVLYAYPHACM